ncbi:MAG TPA: DUF5680 domain-containing protein [Patescibacteria group bacterium]|nr:DUF5680 domain-containing protein [Patescibacteria group bacterium]
MAVDLETIASFLAEANRAGYASGRESAWKKEADGSTTIIYENGSWKFHDNYFGGEPYGGREVIFSHGKAVFMMVYHGRISDRSLDRQMIYGFLRKALALFPEEMPLRGPEYFEEIQGGKKMEYHNRWEGDLSFFAGEEQILSDGKEIYEATYAGGLVDQD